MKIINLKKNIEKDYVEISAEVFFNHECNARKIWFHIPLEFKDELNLSYEPFLAASLINCMWRKENIYIDGEISEKLSESLDTLMDYYVFGNSELEKIRIYSKKTKKRFSKNNFVASFFSGGVDSFYTLLKNQEKITHLILARGFDISLNLEDDNLWNETLEKAKIVSQKYKKKLIPVVTNIKYEYNDLAMLRFWPQSSCGSGCTSVGLLFGDILNDVYIPSSYAYNELIPYYGSHPLIDPLWSTETLNFIHDGCEATRFEKIKRQIIKSDIALDLLRVCWENKEKKYNCCDCEKCLRTMTCLEILGKLKNAKAFPNLLDNKKLSELRIKGERKAFIFSFWTELKNLAEKHGKYELAKSIRKLIRRSKFKNMINDFYLYCFKKNKSK